MAMKGYSAFPKLGHYWSLTIRLFSDISRALVERVFPLCKEEVGVFYSPSRLMELFYPNSLVMWWVLKFWEAQTMCCLKLKRKKGKDCDKMGGIRFCGCGCGYGCQSEEHFVCFGAKPIQRAWARDFPRDRKKADNRRDQKRPGQSAGKRKSTEVGRSRVDQRETMSQRSWWLCGNFVRIDACDS